MYICVTIVIDDTMSNLFTESLFCKWTQTCHFKIKFWAFYETWIRWDNEIYLHKAFFGKLMKSFHIAVSECMSIFEKYGMSFPQIRVPNPWTHLFPEISIFLVPAKNDFRKSHPALVIGLDDFSRNRFAVPWHGTIHTSTSTKYYFCTQNSVMDKESLLRTLW